MIRGLGEICAVLAPLAWSGAVIFYKRSDAPAASMNLFKNVLAFALLTLTMVALGITPAYERVSADWMRVILSALLGLSIADTLLFEGLKRAGAARIAVVDTVYAPVVVVLSWVLLGEKLSLDFFLGALLVLAGISLATYRRGALAIEHRGELVGMAYGMAAIACTALGVVVVKPVLERSSLVEMTWIRLGIGVVGQLVWVAAHRSWANAAVAFRPGPVWKTLIPGALLGTYLSLLLWLGGFKWAPASVAASLNQMATIYILLLARVFLNEKLRRIQWVGAAIATVGALWIVWSRASA